MFFKVIVGLLFFITFALSPVHASNTAAETEDYSRLLDFIALENLEDPLVLFETSDGDFDRDLNKENIDYLNRNAELLETIKSRLKGDSLRWKLNASSKRLLVVPEQRPEFADLFQRYCQKAIGYTLQRIGSDTPYASISTLQEPLQAPGEPAAGGIKAYLVHNVADEYVEEYVFFNQEDDQTKIKIKLSNRVFTGRIGSYTSKLVIGENRSFAFVREPYTIWQNSARNPLNVLIVPVEETLHIILRPITEMGIHASIGQSQPSQLTDLERIVDDWMAVEEAIVGGLVARLMPEIFERYIQLQDKEKLAQAFSERHKGQYRLLNRGIELVAEVGLEEAIQLYRSSPQRFRDLLDEPRHMAAVDRDPAENAAVPR